MLMALALPCASGVRQEARCVLRYCCSGHAALALPAAPAFAAYVAAPSAFPRARSSSCAGYDCGRLLPRRLLGFSLGRGRHGHGIGDLWRGRIDRRRFCRGATAVPAISCLGARGRLTRLRLEGEEDGLEVDQGLNGSLRGRAGIALDQFLLYGTGGVA
jgi:hypothetical protein